MFPHISDIEIFILIHFQISTKNVSNDNFFSLSILSRPSDYSSISLITNEKRIRLLIEKNSCWIVELIGFRPSPRTSRKDCFAILFSRLMKIQIWDRNLLDKWIGFKSNGKIFCLTNSFIELIQFLLQFFQINFIEICVCFKFVSIWSKTSLVCLIPIRRHCSAFSWILFPSIDFFDQRIITLDWSPRSMIFCLNWLNSFSRNPTCSLSDSWCSFKCSKQ